MTKIIFKPPVFVYEKFIKRQKEGVSFVIFLFFLITFVFSRAWVYLSIREMLPPPLIENVNGVHIHHFAYGIVIANLLGYLAFAMPRNLFEIWKIKLAAVFGIGLGLTFDEFAMWLRLSDDYWLRQSYDAIIVLAIIFINIIYFGNFWRKLVRKVASNF